MTRTPSSWRRWGTRFAKSGLTDVSRETDWGLRRRRRPGGRELLRITITKIGVGIVGLMYAAWFVCVVVEAISYPTVG
nr:MAG TPA: hypothetical protein [Caudoviricetes sp.]